MHPKPPSYLALVATGMLLVAGCSRESSEGSAPAGREETAESVETADRAASADPVAPSAPPATVTRPDAAVRGNDGPGITIDAAPGVAFLYRYAFTIPAKAISSVQQQHAAACERLGPTRCQITGMNYSQPREGEVAARLDLLLAPDIARQFGGDSIAIVEQAEGKLEDAQVNGEDAGGAIERSQQQSAGLRAELARVEKRLIAKGLEADERAALVRRTEELRVQLRGEQQLREGKEASLATTPMSFAYSSEGLFAGSDPFGKAAENSFGSIMALGAFLLTFAGLALPWLLLVALIVLLFRFRTMKQRLAQLSATPPAADPTAP